MEFRGVLKRGRLQGYLVLHKQKFVGILVGDERVVRRLFSVISLDVRHTDLTLLAKENTPWKQYENWNMIFQVGDSKSPAIPTEQLFKNNLIGLAQLTAKRTYTSRVYWKTVTELMGDV
ncbi:MAG: BLUF domain-containing protein [Arenibacter algicola]